MMPFSKQLLEGETTQERRSAWRYVFRGVEFTFKKRGLFSKPASGVVADISEVGIFFQTTKRLKKGNSLDITLKFSVRQPIVFKAVVARVIPTSLEEYRVGCFFKPLNAHDLEFIRQFVWWHEFTADASK